MKHLTDLFTLMELTRSQPEYGYVLSGVKQDELSNLAEHQYLVTFVAWQIARQLKKRGAKIDLAKVMEFALIHDLGELFGGDISIPYAQVNPKAKEHAKAFEAENHKFLSKFFGDEKEYFKELSDEILDAKSDEALIAKFADYIEHAHYKQYTQTSTKKFDVDLAGPKLRDIVSKISDSVAKRELQNFIKTWAKDVGKKEATDILYKVDKK
jgi:5'-deoxynucleotidase YfbR-like HD superfamily hydrolase